MKFIWLDRKACIRRIAVMVSCIEGMTIEKAIDSSIHKRDGSMPYYLFCINPDLITPVQRENLRRDAQAYIDAPMKMIAAGRNRRQA